MAWVNLGSIQGADFGQGFEGFFGIFVDPRVWEEGPLLVYPNRVAQKASQTQGMAEKVDHLEAQDPVAFLNRVQC